MPRHRSSTAQRAHFLRTLAASLALTHSPREVSLYGMDLTGGGLARIEPFRETAVTHTTLQVAAGTIDAGTVLESG